jgi:hypothetical protein
MSLLWVVVLIIVPAVLAFAYWRRERHHASRYVETAAWQQEHWQDEHEREKFAQQRDL